jgi:ROS/MUCR transcriptional regulator protein
LDTGTTTEALDYDIRRLAAEIVAAYVSANSVSAAQLPDVIRCVVNALVSLDGQAEAPKEALKPAVSIRKSITPDYLICLEPVPEDVESDESVVIPYVADFSEGRATCGRRRTGAGMCGRGFVTRAI